MHRFFLPSSPSSGETGEMACQTGDRLPLPKDMARQIERVLRLRERDHIVLVCPDGTNLEAELEKSGSLWHGRILRSFHPLTEPNVQVELWQGLLKGDRWDFVLQKGTELGMESIRPLVTERTVARPALGEIKPRWRDILREAAEQSGRNFAPELHAPERLSTTLADLSTAEAGELRLLVWEGVQERGLFEHLQSLSESPHRVLLLLGPEGGLSSAEAEQAIAKGFVPVHLGRRILRAETASLAALTLCLSALGELGAGKGPYAGGV